MNAPLLRAYLRSWSRTSITGILIALASVHGFTQSGHDTIVVTSVEGSWRSPQQGALTPLVRLQVGDDVTCAGAGTVLRVSANGVPVVYTCKGEPQKMTLPVRPGLSERWLTSLRALASTPKPTFVPLVGRGIAAVEAIVRPVDGGLDLSQALVNVDAGSFGVRLEPLPPGPDAAAIETEWIERSRLRSHHTYPPGLYRLQMVTPDGRPFGGDAVVYIPSSPRADEAAGRFSEIGTLTDKWPAEDARAFRVYCLSALAGELK